MYYSNSRRSKTTVPSNVYLSKCLKPNSRPYVQSVVDVSKRLYGYKVAPLTSKQQRLSKTKERSNGYKSYEDLANFLANANKNNCGAETIGKEVSLPKIEFKQSLETKKMPILSRNPAIASIRCKTSRCLFHTRICPRESLTETNKINSKLGIRISEPKFNKLKGEGNSNIKAASDIVTSTPVIDISPPFSTEENITCLTPVKQTQLSHGDDKCVYPLRASLFPNVPPYLNFTTSEKLTKLPRQIRNVLHWKLSTITSSLMRRMVKRTGFTITKDDDNTWLATWGRHISFQQFREFNENQKMNHFPGTFHLGRKDKLWLNIVKMQELNGKENFSFMPETFILPQDMKELRSAWLEAVHRTRWILKPPASARGIGVGVIHRWSEVPKDEPVLVQRYISRPYLINNTKFDLRLYVLVTSFNPLRIYVYEDGLVRFATEKYSRSFKHLSENYIHLTNYSINRSNSSYVTNEDENLPQGHKWSLKCLWSYFRDNGVNEKRVWSSLVDVVIKTVISCEDPISKIVRACTKTRYSCYELFGFDIMLDDSLKPWLLEVNISPSLHMSSQLDLKIKSELIKDTFNTVGFHVPENLNLNSAIQSYVLKKAGSHLQNSVCFNKFLYQFTINQKEKRKQSEFRQNGYNQSSMLNNLTADDIKQLIHSEDELARCGRFIRVFPTHTSSVYLKYFENPKYYNFLLYSWEKKYMGRRKVGIQLLQRLCSKELHLKSIDAIQNVESNDLLPEKKASQLTDEQSASPAIVNINAVVETKSDLRLYDSF